VTVQISSSCSQVRSKSDLTSERLAKHVLAPDELVEAHLVKKFQTQYSIASIESAPIATPRPLGGPRLTIKDVDATGQGMTEIQTR
jgi:hypothetical protein